MRKRYSAEFKARVVLELLREERPLSEVASAYEVHPSMLHRWREAALADLPKLFSELSKRDAEKAEYEKKIHELYAEIGRVTTELEWMKKKGIGTKP